MELFDTPFIYEVPAFSDERGYFSVLYESDTFENEFDRLGIDFIPVQDNQSYNKVKNVFRGMHWQEPPYAQAKLVRCVNGNIIDYAIDIRKDSPTFGKLYSFVLNGDDKPKWVFIPKGFAHGYLSVSDTSIVEYKVDNYYNKNAERGLLITNEIIDDIYNCVGIDRIEDLVISEKDLLHPRINEIDTKFKYDSTNTK